MSAWYSISGTVRVRRCPEVDAIAAKLRAHCDRDFAVNLVPMDAEVDDFSIEGTGEFAAGGVLVLDELLESLGPYAVEAAVLTGEYENEPPVTSTRPSGSTVAVWRYRASCALPTVVQADQTGLNSSAVVGG